MTVLHCSAIGCGRVADGSKSLRLCNAHYQAYRRSNALGTFGRHQLKCAHCGKDFRSREERRYCSVRCYVTSPEAKARFTEAGKKAQAERLGRPVGVMTEWTCLHCGDKRLVNREKDKGKRFCRQTCYRAYMAERFDRYIANPETIALPQCYDDFLDREELPCLVEGCTWVGKHLSSHANLAHGIPADQFKKMAGFNKTTGLVSKDVSEVMSRRKQQWAADFRPVPCGGGNVAPHEPIRLEGREHLAKAFALNGQAERLKAGTEKFREQNPHWREQARDRQRRRAADGSGAFTRVDASCTVCGRTFAATPPQALRDVRLCSPECGRVWHDQNWVKRAIWPLRCCQCLADFLGTYAQHKGAGRGRNVFCSRNCQDARRRVEVPQRKVKKWPLPCFQCGQTFLGNLSQKNNVKRGRRRRCDSCRATPTRQV